MHRIDQPTAQSGLFTDGNESTGVEATIVDAAWLNGMQEGIIQFMLSRGVTPVKADYTKFTEAVLSASQDASSSNITLNNNITVAENISGLVLDKTKYKSAEILIDVYRKDATPSEFNSLFKLHCIYRPIEAKWKMIVEEIFDVSGVQFFLDELSGQVSYKSSNMAGGTYEGILRYKLSRINLNPSV
jgi:hypothetical protein